MNIQETKKFVKKAFKKTNLVPCLLGDTGLGKTEVVHQIADDLGKKVIVLHVSQLEPSDFIGLFKVLSIPNTLITSTEFKDIENYMLNKLKLQNIEFIETMDGFNVKINGKFDSELKVIKTKNYLSLIFMDNITTNCRPNWLPQKYDDSKGYVIFLDEINRGREDIRQSLYQFVQQKTIHTYKLPENCDMISAANPPENSETYEFDDALTCRLLWVPFEPLYNESTNYIREKRGNSFMIDWVEQDKSLLDIGNPPKLDHIKFPPRSLYEIIPLAEEFKDDENFLFKVLCTVMKKEKAMSCISYLQKVATVSAEDIINGKSKKALENVIKNNDLDIINNVCNELIEIIKEKSDFTNEQITNVANFLVRIPIEHLHITMDNIITKIGLAEKKTIINHDIFKDITRAKFKEIKEEVEKRKKVEVQKAS